MARILTDLKDAYRRGNVVIRFIYVNAALFVVFGLVRVFLLLFNRVSPLFETFLSLPADFVRFLMQPWSLVTYMFMHAGVMHILFNMLWLFWFGQLFLSFFSARHFKGVYFLGGILGGIFYMLAYNIFPYFSHSISSSFLVGASASVLAVVTATAYREPNYPIRFVLFGTFQLKYVALFMVVTDLLFLTSGNGGGHISHLGGALAGIWFAASLQKGTDITRWILFCTDSVEKLFQADTWKRKPKMKVYRGGKASDYSRKNSAGRASGGTQKNRSDEEVINRILEKVKKSGYESLTADEKKTLFDASRK